MKRTSPPNPGLKSSQPKSGVGRPQKFGGPSRPVTVTLPESTLEGLQQIDPDRGRAIVKLTGSAIRAAASPPPLVEVAEVESNIGLLIVGPSKALRRIPFLHLVEVAAGRFILALDPGNNFQSLEIALQDVLEELPGDDASERLLVGQLLENIKHARKADRVSMAEILFVDLVGKAQKL